MNWHTVFFYPSLSMSQSTPSLCVLCVPVHCHRHQTIKESKGVLSRGRRRPSKRWSDLEECTFGIHHILFRHISSISSHLSSLFVCVFFCLLHPCIFTRQLLGVQFSVSPVCRKEEESKRYIFSKNIVCRFECLEFTL
jgi:hypothetical protein